MKEQQEFEEKIIRTFAVADALSEKAVEIAAKGNIAIKKEELYKELYPMFIKLIVEMVI